MKVYHDLRESSYYFDFEDLRFYFSSDFYRRRYIERLEAYIEVSILKFWGANKVALPVEGLREYFAVVLYKLIEKRGFRVLKNGEDIEVKINSKI